MSRRSVEWYPSALSDLERIAEYLESAGSNLNAERVIAQLEAKVGAPAAFSLRGRVVPEFAAYGISRYREIIVQRWRVVYRVDERTVTVLTVVDARRQLDELLLERLVRAD